ncbi:MAG: PilZ domain-containing protein [Leptospiraceae bacterium]|nr:PilZ domain-containing protein [Leptospiraceae bacterium]MCP5497150.1 PilZ domain-containing protein [Leptospiraceae bacterium]
MSDKRRHTRYAIKAENNYRIKIKIGNSVKQGKIKDISVSGICIFSDIETFLLLNQLYKFAIEKEDKELISIEGRIIWSFPQQDAKEKLMYYGIEFSHFITLPDEITS